MTDATEAALRAIEAKYLPMVAEGKSLMPFYPREDVSLMIEAAVSAARKACCAQEAFTRDVAAAKLDLYGADARSALLTIQKNARKALRGGGK